MTRPRTVRSADSQPRTYGGTWGSSFGREVCRFFDANRDELLTVDDALVKFGSLIKLSGGSKLQTQAKRTLQALADRGWLSTADCEKTLYGAGPEIFLLTPLE